MARARLRPISRSRRPYNADRLSAIAVACGAGPPCLRKAPHHHSRVTPAVDCSALFDNPCPAGGDKGKDQEGEAALAAVAYYWRGCWLALPRQQKGLAGLRPSPNKPAIATGAAKLRPWRPPPVSLAQIQSQAAAERQTEPGAGIGLDGLGAHLQAEQAAVGRNRQRQRRARRRHGDRHCDQWFGQQRAAEGGRFERSVDSSSTPGTPPPEEFCSVKVAVLPSTGRVAVNDGTTPPVPG